MPKIPTFVAGSRAITAPRAAAAPSFAGLGTVFTGLSEAFQELEQVTIEREDAVQLPLAMATANESLSVGRKTLADMTDPDALVPFARDVVNEAIEAQGGDLNAEAQLLFNGQILTIGTDFVDEARKQATGLRHSAIRGDTKETLGKLLIEASQVPSEDKEAILRMAQAAVYATGGATTASEKREWVAKFAHDVQLNEAKAMAHASPEEARAAIAQKEIADPELPGEMMELQAWPLLSPSERLDIGAIAGRKMAQGAAERARVDRERYSLNKRRTQENLERVKNFLDKDAQASFQEAWAWARDSGPGWEARVKKVEHAYGMQVDRRSFVNDSPRIREEWLIVAESKPREERTLEEQAQLEMMREVVEGWDRAVKNGNEIGLLSRQGHVNPMLLLNLTTVGSHAFAVALFEIGQNGADGSRWAGRELNPFSYSNQQGHIEEWAKTAPPEEILVLLRAMQENLSSAQLKVIADDFETGDMKSNMLGLVMNLVDNDTPESDLVAWRILEGRRSMSDPDNKAFTPRRDKIVNAIVTLLPDLPSSALDSITALYMYYAVEGLSGTKRVPSASPGGRPDADILNQAIEALGGVIEINGATFLAPTPATKYFDIANYLRSPEAFPDADVLPGGMVNAAPVRMDLNTWGFLLDGKMVFDKDGNPLTRDLSDIPLGGKPWAPPSRSRRIWSIQRRNATSVRLPMAPPEPRVPEAGTEPVVQGKGAPDGEASGWEETKFGELVRRTDVPPEDEREGLNEDDAFVTEEEIAAVVRGLEAEGQIKAATEEQLDAAGGFNEDDAFVTKEEIAAVEQAEKEEIEAAVQRKKQLERQVEQAEKEEIEAAVQRKKKLEEQVEKVEKAEGKGIKAAAEEELNAMRAKDRKEIEAAVQKKEELERQVKQAEEKVKGADEVTMEDIKAALERAKAERPEAQLQVRAPRVNVRAAPSVNSKMLTKLVRGNVVQKLGTRGRWTKVRIGPEIPLAWIYSPLLSRLSLSQRQHELSARTREILERTFGSLSRNKLRKIWRGWGGPPDHFMGSVAR